MLICDGFPYSISHVLTFYMSFGFLCQNEYSLKAGIFFFFFFANITTACPVPGKVPGTLKAFGEYILNE